jgi:EAL domain-containing protein (putative c-di-GMP-specific phosphodiesterase class I)
MNGTSGAGQLHVWFPVGLAMRKVRTYLRRTDRPFSVTPTGALAVASPDGYPEELLIDLSSLLSYDEAADTRCVYKNGGGDLDVDDIARVRTVHELDQARESSWFVDLLRGDRLTSIFQPIVHSSEPSRVLGHEALMRGIGHDGRSMSPNALLEAARGCGMLPELDCAARRSAIRTAALSEEKRPLFINVTSESIRGGPSALMPTIHAIESAEIPRERVVLEVIESDRTQDLRQLRGAVDSVRDAGFRVALDDVGCGEHSRRLIHEVRPDFVKLDMERVRMSPLPHLGDAERLLELAQQLHIETIAEGVETAAELDWNRERGATYVQGFLIGMPGELRAA